MTIQEFIDLANQERLANKNKWVFLCESVNGGIVKYKAFSTWVQVLEIKGLRHSSCMDIKVKEYKKFMQEAFINL